MLYILYRNIYTYIYIFIYIQYLPRLVGVGVIENGGRFVCGEQVGSHQTSRLQHIVAAVVGVVVVVVVVAVVAVMVVVVVDRHLHATE